MEHWMDDVDVETVLAGWPKEKAELYVMNLVAQLLEQNFINMDSTHRKLLSDIEKIQDYINMNALLIPNKVQKLM